MRKNGVYLVTLVRGNGQIYSRTLFYNRKSAIAAARKGREDGFIRISILRMNADFFRSSDGPRDVGTFIAQAEPVSF